MKVADKAEPCPSKTRPLRPSSNLFRPRPNPAHILSWHKSGLGWRRRVLPPGPKGLLRGHLSPYPACAGTPLYKPRRLTKRAFGRLVAPARERGRVGDIWCGAPRAGADRPMRVRRKPPPRGDLLFNPSTRTQTRPLSDAAPCRAAGPRSATRAHPASAVRPERISHARRAVPGLRQIAVCGSAACSPVAPGVIVQERGAGRPGGVHEQPALCQVLPGPTS